MSVIAYGSVAGVTGGTTGSLNTTGARLVVAVVTCIDSVTPTLSDSKGNTPTTVLDSALIGGFRNKVYIFEAPTVGTGHTFTVSAGSDLYVSLAVVAFDEYEELEKYSGAVTYDSYVYAGSLTPDEDGAMFVLTLGTTRPDASMHSSENTVVVEVPLVGGTNYGSAIGYYEQTTAAAFNSLWNYGGSGALATFALVFKPAAGGGPTSVTVDLSQDFSVRNAVTKDVSQGFQVFNAVTKDAAQDFSVRNAVTKDVSQGFQVFNAVTKDAAQDFSVRNAVTIDVSQDFQVFNAVTKDAAQDFSVRNAVTKDVSQGFQVFNAVSVDVAQDFAVEDLSGSVTVDVIQGFAVRNSASVDVEQGFAVRNSASVDVEQGFAVREAVTIDLSQEFQVFNTVTKDVDQSFRVGDVIAGNCLDEIVEGDATMRDVLRLLLAANTGITTGAGTVTERFRSLDGTKDRVVTTFDGNGNRQAVSLDAS